MPNIDNIKANADKLNNQINDKVDNATDKFNEKADKVNAKLSKGKSAVLEKKKKIFAKIAAAKAMIGKKKKKLTKSMDSINNRGNALSFLSDLIKSLIGSSALIDVIVNFISNHMQEIEDLIKNSLKEELQKLVSCGINPTVPAFLSSRGIIIELSKIDFLDLFKTDPNSTFGSLMYLDITPQLTNSTDFNTFLYGVIQDDGTQHTWLSMLDITFNSEGAMVGNKFRPNNSLTIKLNPNFSLTKLPNLNNSFITKGQLIDSEKVINKTIDAIYGSVSSVIQKSLKQLQAEAEINDVIDRIVESNSKETIDDGFFTFSNEEIYKQQEAALWRKKGILKLECCNKVAASIPPQMLLDLNAELASATVYNKSDIIKDNINRMAEQNTSNSDNPEDDTNIKLGFVQKVIDTIIKAITSTIISPKIVFIFLINFKIVYGEAEEYANAIDFMKLTRNLFKLIIKKITEKFMAEMMKVALRYIGDLTSEMAAKRLIEKASDKKSQLLSLSGVPQEVLRLIKGLI
jgi:Arc/MetJ-type ribon-helix-helix transcriptional regulator